MSKAHPPELKKFMDRKLSIKVNGGRKVEGVLRGFDPFMNLVIDDAIEYRKDASRNGSQNVHFVFIIPFTENLTSDFYCSALPGVKHFFVGLFFICYAFLVF